MFGSNNCISILRNAIVNIGQVKLQVDSKIAFNIFKAELKQKKSIFENSPDSKTVMKETECQKPHQ